MRKIVVRRIGKERERMKGDVNGGEIERARQSIQREKKRKKNSGLTARACFTR